MKKTYLRPVIDVAVMMKTAILEGSTDGGHSGSSGFEDLDPDANAAKGWWNGGIDFEDLNADASNELWNNNEDLFGSTGSLSY